MSDQILYFEGGEFVSRPRPDWFWHDVLVDRELLEAIGAHKTAIGRTGDPEFGEAYFWHLPDDRGVYAEVWGVHDPLLEVMIPKAADWPKFLVQYLLPLARMHVQERQTAAAERLTEVMTSWARHGSGGHIDRLEKMESAE